MRKFTITVNGKSYDVEVEELGQGTGGAPITAAPAPAATPAPQPAAAPAPAEEAPKAASGGPIPQGADIVEAPMPGTILDIQVQSGDTVQEGQTLMILEAMKMENEIVCPRDGKVASIQVAKGAAVNAGDVLIAIE